MADIKYGRMKLADMMPAEYNPRKDLQPGDREWELESLTQEYDHIDNLMDDDFSDAGSHEQTTFAVTFTFPMSSKEVIDDFIAEEGKEALRDIITTQITGGEE